MRYKIPLKLKRKIELTVPPRHRWDALQEHGVNPDPNYGPLYPEEDDEGQYEPCWSWTGSQNSAGYGQLKFNAKNWNTHRLAWHMLVERLPQPGRARKTDGDILDHVCENRTCCNPAHLDRITQSENVKRGGRHRD